jgi:hypothetical protein
MVTSRINKYAKTPKCTLKISIKIKQKELPSDCAGGWKWRLLMRKNIKTYSEKRTRKNGRESEEFKHQNLCPLLT